MKEKEISLFWEWVKNNIEHLNPKTITDEYINELETKIEKLGDFSWEIGFDSKVGKYFLTISPEGDFELLQLSKDIILHAPKIENWIFYSSKPPKQWKLKFNLLIDDKKVLFDANEWRYVLYKYSDNKYDIVIQVPEYYALYKEYFFQIGDIAVTGELGEGFVIEYINEIELVFEFDDNQTGKDFIFLKTEILM